MAIRDNSGLRAGSGWLLLALASALTGCSKGSTEAAPTPPARSSAAPEKLASNGSSLAHSQPSKPSGKARGSDVVAGVDENVVPDEAEPTAPASDEPAAVPAQEAAPTADCAAGCERRRACGLAEEAAVCASSCEAIKPAFGGTLDTYAQGDCANIQREEPLYQNAVRCAKGCERRVACLNVTDKDACVADCSMAGLKPEHLDEYGSATCEWIQAREADHQQLRQMIHTCKRLLECNVPGTMSGCLGLAKRNLQTGVYGVDKLTSLEQESCDVLQKTAYIEPPPQAAGGNAGGYSGGGGNRWAPGWFGSWTDSHGNKVYHRPPGPGSF